MTSSVETSAPWGGGSAEETADPLRTLCCADAVFAQRYEGWELLGQGSHASVVRVHLRDVGVAVALKVWWRLSEDETTQLRAEAQALMRIVHPCVVRTFAVIDRGPLAWIELELIDGPALRDELRSRRERGEPWPLVQGLEIGACVAEALAAVHAAGFVHRDVKPGNVLLPRTGRPAAKLSDFGIAREIDATAVLGEPLPASMKFLCPEALLGERPGTAGDVYALCVTLYQLLSGGLDPFVLREGASVGEMLECHRRRAPVPLRSLGLGLPEAVVDVIQQGLAKKPHQRPSAAEIARVLRGARDAAPNEATGPRGERPGLRRKSRRLMKLAALVFAVGFALGVGSFLAWLLTRG